jgi:stearoyl-CoA desaturase (delta-9 desaturase)
LYAEAKQDPEVIKLGIGTPNDWVERNVYSAAPIAGILLMLMIDVILFGARGILIWLIQMIWIPFWAAGVINGLAHWWGYRNTDTPDTSRNLVPWAFWIGGEELHNNHHANGAGAKFSVKRWEFDIGWMYIRLLQKLHLATVR